MSFGPFDTRRDAQHKLQPGETQRKIVTRPQLECLLRELRAASPRPTLVHCHGCFDLVHPGHVRHLQFAKEQGDLLIVSITADAAIDKGDARPYIPQELRAENLAALACVDFVVIDPHPTALDLLNTLRPDLYVKGQEYATNHDPRFLAERAAVESYGGRVVFSSGEVVFSSTRLVEALAPAQSLDTQRLDAVCRRHHITGDALSSLLLQFTGLQLLVLGDSIVERYILCDADRLADESPMMTLRELDSEDYLGGAANIALQAAALGARVTLVTGIGRDALSDWISRTLQSFGVEVLPIHDRDEAPLHTRFLVDDRKLLKLCHGHTRPLDARGILHAGQHVLERAASSHAAILYDAGLGLLSPGLTQHIAAELRRRVAFLTANFTAVRGAAGLWKGLDLLCGSEKKLRAGEPDASPAAQGLSTLAFRLLDASEARKMLVTLGKRGVVTFDRRTHDRDSPAWRDRLNSEYLPSLADRVVDRLGIGEAFLTAASLALAVGANLMQSAYLAGAVAAMRIASVGPVPVTAAELQRDLSRRTSDYPHSDHMARNPIMNPTSRPRQQAAGRRVSRPDAIAALP